MRHPSGLKISDLEPIPSIFDQELTSEEAKKVVGGKNILYCPEDPIDDPFPPPPLPWTTQSKELKR